jgi:hypothetical protein
MAIETQVWVAEIENQLFENAPWILRSRNHNAYVNHQKVYVPNSGALPAIQVNPSVFPLTISQRTDTTLEYDLKQYATEPTLVQDWEEILASYNKRTSVLSQHVGIINDRIALETAYAWAVSAVGDTGRIIRTSGANGNTLAPGATGTRKLITRTDIANAARVLDRDKVSKQGRILLMDSGMFYELFADTNLITADVMGRPTLVNGMIPQLHGFEIYTYNYPVIYDNTTVPVKKAIGAATATSDNLSCLFFQVDAVANALGAVKAYAREDEGTLLGSYFNAMVLHAGTILRTDKAGVGAIVQAA